MVDLRSGGYMALAPAPGATTLDVVSEAADGSRSTVSHANKSFKGRAARLLASTRRRPKDTGGVLAVLADAGLRVEQAPTALGNALLTWSPRALRGGVALGVAIIGALAATLGRTGVFRSVPPFLLDGAAAFMVVAYGSYFLASALTDG